jgi:hypothetical protein
VGGQREAPINVPSDVAAELRQAEEVGPLHRGFTRHATFASFGSDARIFYLESFAGHPAYAVLMQGDTEIQLALFPVVPTRTANPEFAKQLR